MSKSKFFKKDKIDDKIIPSDVRVRFDDVDENGEFFDEINRGKHIKIDHIHALDKSGNKVIFYPDDDVIVKNPDS